jgi:hypothetical protein
LRQWDALREGEIGKRDAGIIHRGKLAMMPMSCVILPVMPQPTAANRNVKRYRDRYPIRRAGEARRNGTQGEGVGHFGYIAGRGG